ncbi:hypothetical protein LH20_05890 [Sphingopyxis sp. 113P3]|nr:hypothetical protein LH20_05890 [Sphingopyxis sp. 113P3]
MRGGDGLGDGRQYREPRLEGNGGKSALILGPARQVRPAICAFHEPGPCVEIPFEHGHQIGSLAKNIPQQARYRHFALQPPEPIAVVRELEDPQFAGLLVPRPPDRTRPAGRQAQVQTPCAAPRHGIALFQAQRRGRRPGRRRNRHGKTEAIAHPRHGDDDRALPVVQRLAELGDGCGQRALDDMQAGPHPVEQLRLGDDLAGLAQKLQQDVERLAFQRNRPSVLAQRPPAFVEGEVAETPDAMLRRGTMRQILCHRPGRLRSLRKS